MVTIGDHGGESKAERTAAFFAYRGAGFSGVGDSTIGIEVQQTDFAPTLSAALGLPPPAPSLGNLLLPVLPKTSVPVSLLQMTNTLKQITQYLIRYGEESQQVPLDRLALLINSTREQMSKAVAVETEEELDVYLADVKALSENTRNVFREVWVEFDSLSMLRALLLLLLAIFFNWLITEGLPIERVPLVFASSFVPTGYAAMAVCISLCYTAYSFKLIEDVVHAIILSTGLASGAITSALVIMHWDGITQRWYEGRSLFYERFARGALVASAAVLVSNSYIIEEGAGLSFLALSVLGLMAWNVGTLKALGLWLAFGGVLAATRNYRGCREEQGDCWTAGGGVVTGQASRAALVLALGATAAVVAVARRYVGWRGHGVVVAGLLACGHWAVGWGSLGSPSRSRLLARCSWVVLIGMFALLWRRERDSTVVLLVCSLLIYIANTLVLGAAYAPAAALALVSGFLALNIVSFVACAWALLASYHFYGTGHHATVGHVRWAPAFHAGDPNYTVAGHQIMATFSFACALSATIHCRHLMIWGVFTPKLLFESAACGAALLGTLIGASLAAWHLPASQRNS
ncbi:hypothetical protein MSG28_008650 [Choristoneura fumiferana]|uniref:Uncharacterized protein n=1 Tax=Choristoneura fumiferana TaxID=7141 RepID=A0ACC0J7K9_CHOFU|nr:hypothetical protein MSG28_008650 [Choristoneura fumiferana]